MKGPVLVVGVGGAAGRLARQVNGDNCERLLISNDKRDLDDGRSIFVNAGAWVNPSVQRIRAFLAAKSEQLRSALEGFNTVIVIANLAGRSGAAMAPLVCDFAARQGSTVISFAIMPFGFEKDRMFAAGVALRRVRSLSHSTIVLDNDAFLDNNPGLSKEECHALTNSAILEVISGIASRGGEAAYEGTSILTTSAALRDSEESLRDSVSMLYKDTASSDPVRRAIIYVTGGEKLPVGILNQLAGQARGVFRDEGTTEISVVSAPAAAAAAAAQQDGSGGGGVRVHLVSSATAKTRFDSYDPLGEVIPLESHLDWEEPDSAPDIELPIPLVLRE